MRIFFSSSLFYFFHCLHGDTSLFLYKSDIRTANPGKHAPLCVLAQCREPRPNERDILMASHLFMHGKWRGTVTFFEGVDRIKRQHWGGNDCIYDLAVTDEGIRREADWHTDDSSKCSMMWCMATRSSSHFKNECLRSADLGGDLKVLLLQQQTPPFLQAYIRM